MVGFFRPYYSAKHRKFFIFIDFESNFRKRWWRAGENLTLTVNRNDLKSPKYGTRINPIPVLAWKDSLDIQNPRFTKYDNFCYVHNIEYIYRLYDKHHIDSLTKNNVTKYLQYTMSNEEFKRRFKSK